MMEFLLLIIQFDKIWMDNYGSPCRLLLSILSVLFGFNHNTRR